MARIAGVDLPRDKRLEIGLTYIFGVGHSRAREACEALGIDPNTKVRDLTDDEVVKIRQYIDANFRVEGDLRREVAQNVKRKVEIGSYQGLRHRRGHCERSGHDRLLRQWPDERQRLLLLCPCQGQRGDTEHRRFSQRGR